MSDSTRHFGLPASLSGVTHLAFLALLIFGWPIIQIVFGEWPRNGTVEDTLIDGRSGNLGGAGKSGTLALQLGNEEITRAGNDDADKGRSTGRGDAVYAIQGITPQATGPATATTPGGSKPPAAPPENTATEQLPPTRTAALKPQEIIVYINMTGEPSPTPQDDTPAAETGASPVPQSAQKTTATARPPAIGTPGIAAPPAATDAPNPLRQDSAIAQLFENALGPQPDAAAAQTREPAAGGDKNRTTLEHGNISRLLDSVLGPRPPQEPDATTGRLPQAIPDTAADGAAAAPPQQSPKAPAPATAENRLDSDPLATVMHIIDTRNAALAQAIATATPNPPPVGAFANVRLKDQPESKEERISRLLAQAAEAGLARAQITLAQRHLSGLAPHPSAAKAVALLKAAAEQYNVTAQLALGVLLMQGRIGEPDPVEASIYFRLAEEQVGSAGGNMIPLLERQMSPRDIVTARRYAREYQSLLRASLRKPDAANLSPAERQKLRTEMLEAAAAGDTPKVARLLARGVDLEGADTAGRTAVINAAWRGRLDAIELLIFAGANFATTDYAGRSAVTWAASNGHAGVLARLLEIGATPEIIDKDGLTPLMRAAWNGHVSIVQTLLDSGADTKTRDPEGRTALDYAVRGDHAAVVQLIERHGS